MSVLDRFRLDGKVAVVTGSSRGIGRGVAEAFAEAGADVVCSSRKLDDVSTVANALRKHGRRCLAVECNVLQQDDRAALVESSIAEFGRVDILVNNVGGWPPQPALETKDEDFDKAFRFNVSHAFSLTRDFAAHLKDGDSPGSVINISSVAGIEPAAGFSAYGTAKAAMNFLTREMAQDFAPKVRVNAIACGSVQTDALATVLTEDILKQMIDMTPMGRLANVDDIAAAAVYLASDAASYVTGQIVGVSGGLVGLNLPMPRAWSK